MVLGPGPAGMPVAGHSCGWEPCESTTQVPGAAFPHHFILRCWERSAGRFRGAAAGLRSLFLAPFSKAGTSYRWGAVRKRPVQPALDRNSQASLMLFTKQGSESKPFRNCLQLVGYGARVLREVTFISMNHSILLKAISGRTYNWVSTLQTRD